MKKRMIYDLDAISDVTNYLYEQLSICSIYTFTGPLGAGKTTLIRALLRECGITEPITSPTFTYVNIYENKYGQTYYHFDLYRIISLQQFVDAGFDEYLYQPNSWCFIEWPEVIEALLKNRVCRISLDYYGLAKREAIITIDK